VTALLDAIGPQSVAALAAGVVLEIALIAVSLWQDARYARAARTRIAELDRSAR